MENLVVGQLIILLLAFFLISHHLSAWFLISHHLSAWYCKEKFGLGRLCKVWNVKIKNMFKDISVFPLISSQLLEPRILLISLKKGNKSGGCNLLYARKIGMILQWKEQPEKDLVSHATKFLYNSVRLEISVYNTWILVYVKSCGQSSCCNLFNYLFHSYADSFLNFHMEASFWIFHLFVIAWFIWWSLFLIQDFTLNSTYSTGSCSKGVEIKEWIFYNNKASQALWHF